MCRTNLRNHYPAVAPFFSLAMVDLRQPASENVNPTFSILSAMTLSQITQLIENYVGAETFMIHWNQGHKYVGDLSSPFSSQPSNLPASLENAFPISYPHIFHLCHEVLVCL